MSKSFHIMTDVPNGRRGRRSLAKRRHGVGRSSPYHHYIVDEKNPSVSTSNTSVAWTIDLTSYDLDQREVDMLESRDDDMLISYDNISPHGLTNKIGRDNSLSTSQREDIYSTTTNHEERDLNQILDGINDMVVRESPFSLAANLSGEDGMPIKVWSSDSMNDSGRSSPSGSMLQQHHQQSSDRSLSRPSPVIRLWDTEPPPRPENPVVGMSRYQKALARLDGVRRRTSDWTANVFNDTDILTSKHEQLMQQSREYQQNSRFLNDIELGLDRNDATNNQPAKVQEHHNSKRLFIDTSSMDICLYDRSKNNSSSHDSVRDLVTAFSYEFKKRIKDEPLDIICIDDILTEEFNARTIMKTSSQISATYMTSLDGDKAQEGEEPSVPSNTSIKERKCKPSASSLLATRSSLNIQRRSPLHPSLDVQRDKLLTIRNTLKLLRQQKSPRRPSSQGEKQKQAEQQKLVQIDQANANACNLADMNKQVFETSNLDPCGEVREISDVVVHKSPKQVTGVDQIRESSRRIQLAVASKLTRAEKELVSKEPQPQLLANIVDGATTSAGLSPLSGNSETTAIDDNDHLMKQPSSSSKKSPQSSINWTKSIQDVFLAKEKVDESNMIVSMIANPIAAFGTSLALDLVNISPSNTDGGAQRAVSSFEPENKEDESVSILVLPSTKKLTPDINGNSQLVQNAGADEADPVNPVDDHIQYNTDKIFDASDYGKHREIPSNNGLDDAITQGTDMRPSAIKNSSSNRIAGKPRSTTSSEDNEDASQPTIKTGNKVSPAVVDKCSADAGRKIVVTSNIVAMSPEAVETVDVAMNNSIAEATLTKESQGSISEDYVSCATDAETKVSIVDSETTDSEMEEEQEIYGTCAGVPYAIRLLDVTCAWLEKEETAFCFQPSLLKEVKKRDARSSVQSRRVHDIKSRGRQRATTLLPHQSALSRCFGESHEEKTETKGEKSRVNLSVINTISPVRREYKTNKKSSRGKQLNVISVPVDHFDSGENIQDVVTPISSNKTNSPAAGCFDDIKDIENEDIVSKYVVPFDTSTNKTDSNLDLSADGEIMALEKRNVESRSRNDIRSDHIIHHTSATNQESSELRAADVSVISQLSSLQQLLRAKSSSPRNQRKIGSEYDYKASNSFPRISLPPNANVISSESEVSFVHLDEIHAIEIASDVGTHHASECIHIIQTESTSDSGGSVGEGELLTGVHRHQKCLDKRRVLLPRKVNAVTASSSLSALEASTLSEEQRYAAQELTEKLRRRATTLTRRRMIRERRKEQQIFERNSKITN